MALTLNQLPVEILFLITFFLKQKPSLCSLIRTARFLKPYGEYHLYHSVNFTDDCRDLGSDSDSSVLQEFSKARRNQFLETIAETPRLALLVNHLAVNYYYDQNAVPWQYDDEGMDFDAFNDDCDIDYLLSVAAPALANLKTIQLTDVAWPPTMPGFLTHPTPNSSLHTLSLEIDNFRDEDSDSEGVDLLAYDDRFESILKNHSNLRHFAMTGLSEPGLSVSKLDRFLERFSGGCPSLETLEGPNSVVRLLLPGRKAKHLLWKCEYPDEWMSDSNPEWLKLSKESRFQKAYLTPALREAYGHLMHLAIFKDLSLLPYIAPFLTSLTSLFLEGFFDDLKEPGGKRVRWCTRLLPVIKQIPLLTTLVVVVPRPANPDGSEVEEMGCSGGFPSVSEIDDLHFDRNAIFDECGGLTNLVLLRRVNRYRGTLSVVSSRRDMEKDGHYSYSPDAFKCTDHAKVCNSGVPWFE